MKFSDPPSTDFFTSSYILINFAMIMAYPTLRMFTSAGKRDLRHKDTFGFTYQNSIIYMGVVILIICYVRSTSLRGFILDGLTVGKLIVISLLFFAKYQWCIYYIVVCAILWITVPYPRYRGKHNFIKIESVEQFDQIMREHESIKKPKKSKDELENEQYQYQDKFMYFIEFYADWVAACSIAKQLWYSYSLKYETPRLKFLQINVQRLPELAERYKINTSGFTRQLPTVMIVENDQEVIRFPFIKEHNKVDRVVKLDYKILLKYFDLQSRYLETRQIPDQSDTKKDN